VTNHGALQLQLETFDREAKRGLKVDDVDRIGKRLISRLLKIRLPEIAVALKDDQEQ